MIRTQIYLPDEMHTQLQQIAQAKSTSMAQITRKLIENSLKTYKEIDTSGRSIMRKLLKMNIKGGPKDLSTNIDHYLYGGPKKKK